MSQTRFAQIAQASLLTTQECNVLKQMQLTERKTMPSGNNAVKLQKLQAAVETTQPLKTLALHHNEIASSVTKKSTPGDQSERLIAGHCMEVLATNNDPEQHLHLHLVKQFAKDLVVYSATHLAKLITSLSLITQRKFWIRPIYAELFSSSGLVDGQCYPITHSTGKEAPDSDSDIGNSLPPPFPCMGSFQALADDTQCRRG